MTRGAFALCQQDSIFPCPLKEHTGRGVCNSRYVQRKRRKAEENHRSQQRSELIFILPLSKAPGSVEHPSRFKARSLQASPTSMPQIWTPMPGMYPTSNGFDPLRYMVARTDVGAHALLRHTFSASPAPTFLQSLLLPAQQSAPKRDKHGMTY